jgi:hypothetical protein
MAMYCAPAAQLCEVRRQGVFEPSKLMTTPI